MIAPVIMNPFRIIGISVNASLKERLTNLSKINAYSRIGRDVVFPFDLLSFMKKIDRSERVIQTAIYQLNTSTEFLRYSLFWFYTLTPQQKEAGECLKNGDIKQAEKIYRKDPNVTSIISCSTSLFVQKRVNDALLVLNKLVKTEESKDEFVSVISEICGQSFALTTEELLENIIDGALEHYTAHELQKIYKVLSKSDKSPLYDNIEDIINKRKKIQLLKNIESNIKVMEDLMNKDVVKAFKECDVFLEDVKKDIKFLEKNTDVGAAECQALSDKAALFLFECVEKMLDKIDARKTNTSIYDIKRCFNLVRKGNSLACSPYIVKRFNGLRGFLSEIID